MLFPYINGTVLWVPDGEDRILSVNAPPKTVDLNDVVFRKYHVAGLYSN
jgi:hypothetical protein